MRDHGITAELIQCSTNWLGKNLYTFKLRYPRYIHAELLTHRVFSRNSASSRAIPIAKAINSVTEDPVVPIWTYNQRGMQGNKVNSDDLIRFADQTWTEGRVLAVGVARALDALSIHKQNVNRVLEPYQFIRVILTGTDFDNFFKLRDHEAAQPEIAMLARKMREEYDKAEPTLLHPGQWHIPFSDQMNDIDAEIDMLKIATARAARVSYHVFGEIEINYAKDIELYNRLVTEGHFSPAEHQARVPFKEELEHLGITVTKDGYNVGKYFSNLFGWVQLRKVIENGEFR